MVKSAQTNFSQFCGIMIKLWMFEYILVMRQHIQRLR